MLRYFRKAIAAKKEIFGSWVNDITGHSKRLTQRDIELFKEMRNDTRTLRRSKAKRRSPKSKRRSPKA